MRELELWGGHECTVNRVGDRYFDQTSLSGHQERPCDLDLFAGLGVKALRYPILWERTAPDHSDTRHWDWPDRRLGRLAELGVRPIVGLIHHGSGPRYTNLLDDAFAPGLAAFAGAVARRYPHVRDWTPVNEPLTTARFSALYGLWYPHLTDEKAFWTALLNQIDATRLAMAAIRAVTPDARLIQTEDLGRTYATTETADQARFDNERRWMTWDLLSGRVGPGHFMWRRLADFGLVDRLAAIADEPCPPDVIGVNHYVTSDRLLDPRRERYPRHTWGGNTTIHFADVEAIRALTPAPAGLAGALEEAARRYELPLAVTECHLNCGREDQIRWLTDAWRTVVALRKRGVEIQALTAWALLGSYDWNCLLTRSTGCYESGAFDVRGPTPRATAVAATLRTLARGSPELHPVTDSPGWWRRDIRLLYPSVLSMSPGPAPKAPPPTPTPRAKRRPLLITGATGTLGRAFSRACERRGVDHVLTDRGRMSLGSVRSIEWALDELTPWAVINTAGWVRVDEAEQRAVECFAANTTGAARLADACAARGLPSVGFSSDLVFDGRARAPYVETDAPAPRGIYGESKARAEKRILDLEGALMIRSAAFFSAHDRHNFAVHVARALAAGREFEAAGDLVVSPTHVPDLVDAALDLLVDGETGLWHLANRGAVSWAGFALMIARALDLDEGLIRARPHREFGWAAERPAYAALASTRGLRMPTLEDAVERFAAAARHEGLAGTTAPPAGPADLRVDAA